MIVDSMTHKEVYKELERDREAMTRWWMHQVEGMRRVALKGRTFPIVFTRDYTSPRKVRYLFIGHVFDRHNRTGATLTIAVRWSEGGMTTYVTWTETAAHIAPMVIMPHAWRRYAERAGVAKSGMEMVKHFYLRNSIGMDSRNERAVSRSVRYNGETHIACCVPDGVLLGNEDGGIFIARTFITYDMCGGIQAEEFGRCRSKVPSSVAATNPFAVVRV